MKIRGLSFCILFLSTMVYAQETGSVLKVAIDGLTYKLNQGTHTAMVANANSWEGELDIPEQVVYDDETYIVDKLEWLAFDLCKTLTKVRIPKTVVKIQHYAGYEECKNPFRNCTSLESIEVDETNPSMCSINGVLFSKDKTQLYCYPAGAKRETYSVPDGVKWLCAEAFAFNSYLTSINMPNSVTNMCFGTFCCCKSLNSIRLSENIKRISAWTFEKCESLHFLDIPESVMSFEERVFSWSPIKTIVIRGTFPEGLRNDTFYFIDDEVIIYVQPSEVEKFKKVFTGTVLPLSDWAQNNYRPFVEEGKVWKVGDTYGISDGTVKLVEYYYFDGDTIIDGKTCKQMMRQLYVNPDYPNYASIIQYPLLTKNGVWYEKDKKVYVYNLASKQFMMMYDFSLEANDTLLIDESPYVIGPKLTGELHGFKGVYRDIMWASLDGNNSYCTTWLEGVGGIDGPTRNAYPESADPVPEFLMSCTVGDEVIYLNDDYEDGATPEDMGAKKHRFDFTHTVKTQPRMPTKRVEEAQSLYGEYSNLRLGINLDPLDAVYQVRITNESGKVVYEKAINAGNIVALDIDISTYAEGRYTVTVENSHETFSGEFEMQTTGIEEVRNKHELVRGYIYNLQGQRISSLRKGLNIVNGKKIFVK